ncbi:MAG: hypothetical protein QOI08_2924, partial [Actinomycetota bacterium]|nr:hypothetical protein [Actinomycetota bacterium]
MAAPKSDGEKTMLVREESSA